MLGKFSENVTPLKWSEIDSFNTLLKIGMDSWEAETLMMMSKAYCHVYHQSKEPNYPPPYSIETDEIRQQRANSVSAGFKALASRKKSGLKKRG